jgi:hypothetical protein
LPRSAGERNHREPARLSLATSIAEELFMPDKPSTPAKSKPENDAKGQLARPKRRSDNDGVASANPRVISGKEDGDATFTEKGLPRKKPRS